MAQYAGRASVALNTHLFFKGRTQEEEGYIQLLTFFNYYILISFIYFRYVLCVRKNALQILIPKFGLEGTIYVSGGTKDKEKQMAVKFEYNEEVGILYTLNGVKT